MHVLITRPEGDGEPLKAQIEQLGCRATLAPLISIVSGDPPFRDRRRDGTDRN